jgi:pyruvate/2-oxoglutarate dehydrogenase complex dihydrolipoamide dehydrogenase (E3) component
MASAASDYDAIVIGAGPGGRGCASRLIDARMRVAMLESELVGGECPFWACIPSKTLLRPAEVVSEADHAAGLSEPASRWREISDYRDYMNSGLDDSAKFDAYSKRGIDVIRGRGRIVDRGVVEVGDRRLESKRIIIATGTFAAVPEIDGLADVPYWTNREGTTLKEVPSSAIVLGGGPVGVELGQMLARYGSRVTIVEAAERLLVREHAKAGELLAEALQKDGIDVRTGAKAEGVEGDSGATRVHLGDGDVVEGERLLVAIGRRARVDGIGLEVVGAEFDQHGIKIDSHCRAAPGVWAVGDVTGVAQFTHVAAYQARIACADIQGRNIRADYRAVPRVVFSDPEVAAVGLTPEQAVEAGIDVVEASVDLSEVDRTETYGRDLTGQLGLVADAQRKVVVGAWALGPLASEWIHFAVLAIKAEVPVSVLQDTVMQFPTFSEAFLTAVDRLPVA